MRLYAIHTLQRCVKSPIEYKLQQDYENVREHMLWKQLTYLGDLISPNMICCILKKRICLIYAEQLNVQQC